MNNRVPKAIRRAFDLPRLKRKMSPEQRLLYSSVKARYAKLPAPARRTFLDNVTLLRSTIKTT